MSTGGKFAVLTNYWNPELDALRFLKTAPLEQQGTQKFYTRGAIPISVLTDKTPENIYAEKDSYKPFNLVAGDLRGNATYVCNPGPGCEGVKVDLSEGVHCVSNQHLNGEWNKVQKLKNDLKSFLDSNPSFEPEDVIQLLLDDVKLDLNAGPWNYCLLYTSPSPRDS